MEWLKRLFAGFQRREPELDLSAMMGEPRQHHYGFAHRALRSVATQEPMMIFTLLVDPSRSQAFLKDLWGQVAERLRPDEKPLPPDGLRVVITQRQGDFAIAIVALPPPRSITECYYVALVVGPLPSEGTKVTTEDLKAIPLHSYFTLEYGFPLPEPRTVLCSWKDGTHNNFGDGPDPDDPMNFYNRVCVMVGTPDLPE